MLHTYLTLVRELMAMMEREEGQDLIEYALLVGFIALVAVVGVNAAGVSISNMFSNIAASLAGVSTTLP